MVARPGFFKHPEGGWDYARITAVIGAFMILVSILMATGSGMSPGSGWLMVSGMVAIFLATQFGLIDKYGGARLWHVAVLAVVSFAIAIASDFEAETITFMAVIAFLLAVVNYSEWKNAPKGR